MHMIFLNLSRLLSFIGFAFKVAAAILRSLISSAVAFGLRGEMIRTLSVQSF